jgi:voltage-gated potassium channel
MRLVRRWGRLVGGCVLVVLAYFYLPLTRDEVVRPEAANVMIVVVAIVGMAWLVVLEVRHQIDDFEDRRIDRLVVSVVVVMVGFSLIFYLLERANPTQISGLHTRIDALYFTVTTMSTVGYGDIHATGQIARMLVVIQIVFNLVIITTAAHLVSSKVREGVTEWGQRRRHHHLPDAPPPAESSAGSSADFPT